MRNSLLWFSFSFLLIFSGCKDDFLLDQVYQEGEWKEVLNKLAAQKLLEPDEVALLNCYTVFMQGTGSLDQQFGPGTPNPNKTLSEATYADFLEAAKAQYFRNYQAVSVGLDTIICEEEKQFCRMELAVQNQSSHHLESIMGDLGVYEGPRLMGILPFYMDSEVLPEGIPAKNAQILKTLGNKNGIEVPKTWFPENGGPYTIRWRKITEVKFKEFEYVQRDFICEVWKEWIPGQRAGAIDLRNRLWTTEMADFRE